MPVIGGADEYDFWPLFSQQFAVVPKHRRFLFGWLAFGDQFRRGLHRFTVHIAEADDFHRRNLDQMKQIGLSVPATANQCHAQRLFFPYGEEACFRRRQCNRAGSTCLQKISSGHISALSFCFPDVRSERGQGQGSPQILIKPESGCITRRDPFVPSFCILHFAFEWSCTLRSKCSGLPAYGLTPFSNVPAGQNRFKFSTSSVFLSGFPDGG